MDPIAQAAGTALVQAVTTDAWQQVKQAVTGLWRRIHPGRADQVGGDLDELRAQVLQARAEGDAGTEQALEGAWQLRLQEFLRADPALAADLRQVLDAVLTPALPAAGQARIGTILMTGTSRDSSTFTQIGVSGQLRPAMTAGPEAAAEGPVGVPAMVMHGQSHDASTFRQTGIEVNILPRTPATPEVRYSLPPDAAAFTGRDAELGKVTAAVAAAGEGGVVAVHAIDGMPGTGKTALAVHAAHMLRDRFPDRQLFIDLHAHTPGREPVRPEDALAVLLAAAGLATQCLPGDLDGRAAMWRDRMAGQHALLVLDNAASTRQVTPLLPRDGTCLVLVTSRRHLGDLPGAVTQVPLDVLTPAQAADMFTRLAPRAAGSPGEVAEVVELAGFLPLAISLLARLFVRHQSWTLADLAAETRASLLTLTAEHENVAAAFEMSYRHLDPARQRFFCLLGLHPGATIEPYAAAALAQTHLNDAAGLLDALHGEGLLTEIGHRRYGLHDLLRRYARDHAAGLPGSEQAVERLLDYYQYTAARADALIALHTQPGPPPPVPAGLPAPDLKDKDQALAWARADRASLLACLDHVTRTGQHARVIALTAGIAGLLRRDGPFADAITRHTAAARAAAHLGDRLGQANALTHLGSMRWRWADYQDAAQALEQALHIYRDLCDQLGQANALVTLGSVRRLTGEYQGGSRVLEQALHIYRDIGDRLGQANALTYLGKTRQMSGDYPGAVQVLEQGLEIYRDLCDRRGQANALVILGSVRRRTGNYLGAARWLEQALGIYRDIGARKCAAATLNEWGTLHRVRGDFKQAERYHQQALELARAVMSSWDEAHALAGLGHCATTSGHATQAEDLLRQALEIFQRIGAAEGPDIAGLQYG